MKMSQRCARPPLLATPQRHEHAAVTAAAIIKPSPPNARSLSSERSVRVCGGSAGVDGTERDGHFDRDIHQQDRVSPDGETWTKLVLRRKTCGVDSSHSRGRYAAAAGVVLTGRYRRMWCADEQRVVELEIQLHGTNKISVSAAAIHT
ncbi:unnamed protein product [Pleuronectes platessa]|uniref:Uncharacterized protein n=1 Tax=Pleuronectes platessa TaxID=8262 RepID=A0A9N7U1E8_PLEPL|nr:unnamed protein product [Pleuronectes platessa]